MAREGDTPDNFRSEAERIRPRAAGALFKDDSESMPGVREHVRSGTYQDTLSQENLSPERKLLRQIVVSLCANSDLSTSDITVEVRDSIVLLTGSVDTLNTKYRTEEIVKRLEGVSRIENHLAVRVGEALEEFTRGSDASRLREEFTRSTKRD